MMSDSLTSSLAWLTELKVLLIIALLSCCRAKCTCSMAVQCRHKSMILCTQAMMLDHAGRHAAGDASMKLPDEPDIKRPACSLHEADMFV